MDYKVTMICREIWRATVIVKDRPSGVYLEDVKDTAWAKFDNEKSKDLEQENYTKVEALKAQQ